MELSVLFTRLVQQPYTINVCLEVLQVEFEVLYQ